MQNVKISIIMPVYNHGIYLEESIGSILKQTFQEFELICVDDASNDGLTKEILDKQNGIDDRIRIISLEKNVGAGEARNIGFRHAAGEYVIFLDADDIFESVMLESMYRAIAGADADMCIAGYDKFAVINNRMRIVTESGLGNLRNVPDVFCLENLPEEGLTYWSTAPWNKLCKKNFLEKNEIFFQNLSSSNDVFYSIKCSICAKKIVCANMEELLIHHRIASGQQISSERIPECMLEAVDFLINNFGDNLTLTNSRQIVCLLAEMIKYEFSMCTDMQKWSKFYYCVRDFMNKRFQGISLENQTYRQFFADILFEEYRKEWVIGKMDFYCQLFYYKEEIFQSLKNAKNIIVWGDGARGKAFQKLCEEEKKKIAGIVDKRNKKCGGGNSWDNRILSCEEALRSEAIIIATNKAIYNMLLTKIEKGRIFDLEKYCE